MKSDNGFTLVEVIISLSLVGVFIGSLVVGYGYISSQKEDARRYTIASAMAKSNLNKYLSNTSVPCTADTRTNEHTLLNNSSAMIESTEGKGLINPEQMVTIQYRHGCDQLPTLSSSISFGVDDNRKTVVLVDYAR